MPQCRELTAARVRRLATLAINWLLLSLCSSVHLVAAFEFYPPFLPSYIAANETITHVELRLYLGVNETTSIVRMTPVSDSIQFTPREVVFTSTTRVVQSITMVGHTNGLAQITFLAQVEQELFVVNSSSTASTTIILQNATQIATQEIHVLAPPLSYAIDDPLWHGVILLNDSFEESSSSSSFSSSPLWDKIRHGYPSTACGAYDGSRALYFTALGDRFARTKPLSLLGFDGKLHFRQRYGDRVGQQYDLRGDNRVSCERVDAGEEIVLSYLPPHQDENNASAWREIRELPLLTNTTTGGEDNHGFTAYSIALPATAMHAAARFRWHQKTHSSFPVDPVTGLTLAMLLDAANDDTSTQGELGVTERELWKYRNLFDQWALDDVQLEVRLTPPLFQLLANTTATTVNTTDDHVVVVSVGFADVLVDSPVLRTWTEFTIGDGTHAFPTCDPVNAVKATTTTNVTNVGEMARLDASGYVHAVACLDVYNDSTAIVSSFPSRSKRVLVRATTPRLTVSVDRTTSVDTWTVEFACDVCTFMRYTAFSSPVFTSLSSDVEEEEEDGGSSSSELSGELIARVAPSCSYGALVNSSSGSVQVNANNRIFVVACGDALLASEIAMTDALTVAPRVPTFDYTPTPTTITNQFELVIVPPPRLHGRLGIAYTVSDHDAEADQPNDPVCPTPELVTPGNVTITVRASDVVRAVACCVGVICSDSVVAVWGPIQVKAVAPVFSMACSHVKPLTVVVELTPVTTDAWIQYHVVGPSSASVPPPLDCTTESESTPFLITGNSSNSSSIEVTMQSTRVLVVSCLRGLQPSDRVEIAVSVDHCCAGIDSYRYATCAHVLLLHDDFSTCLDASKWTKLTTQWGGDDVNGGVHSDNVQCGSSVVDTLVGSRKNVLQLQANGDLFPGTSPVGLKRSSLDATGALVERTIDDRLLEWALDGVSPTPCNGNFARCPARRVGAAVQTAATALPQLEEDAGVVVVRLKPCDQFGTLTQIGWGDITSRDDQVLQQVPFLPLWKASMYQAKTTPDVAFVHSSPSQMAVPDNATTASAADPAVEDDGFIQVVMQWNATLGRSNLYVNGKLVHKQVLNSNSSSSVTSTSTSTSEPLVIGVWFPNAVAGEPLFESCQVVVDEVRVFKAQVTGERWCDFEHVNAQHQVPCVSDTDCDEWVTSHCFMPLHEAVCIEHRVEPLEQQQSTEDDDGDLDTGDEVASSGPAALRQSFCQFRLQPGISQSNADASLGRSHTEMNQRYSELAWHTEEGHDMSLPPLDEQDQEEQV